MSPAKEEPEGPRMDADGASEGVAETAEALLEKLQYVQADFENYRKRIEREREELTQFANMGLVTQLLPTLDAFDVALSSLEGDAKEGVAMVYGGLLKTLEAAGLKEVPSLGQPFDPYVHEITGFTDGPDRQDGTIVEVVQKGYTFRSRVARPSKVIVLRSGGEDE